MPNTVKMTRTYSFKQFVSGSVHEPLKYSKLAEFLTQLHSEGIILVQLKEVTWGDKLATAEAGWAILVYEEKPTVVENKEQNLNRATGLVVVNSDSYLLKNNETKEAITFTRDKYYTVIESYGQSLYIEDDLGEQNWYSIKP